MFYEGYVQRYTVDEDENGVSFESFDEPEYVDDFSSYEEAVNWFSAIAKNHDGLARWYVKVYITEEATIGEIVLAGSMVWDDNLFNERAV